TVNVAGIAITGGDTVNYLLQNTTATATANITARTLTINAIAANKTYDGTAAATATLSDNRVSGDVLTLSYAGATFSDKNAGTGKSVTITGVSVSGADAANYAYSSTASATANISSRALTVSASGVNKIYDGTTTANVNLTDNRLNGDVLAD